MVSPLKLIFVVLFTCLLLFKLKAQQTDTKVNVLNQVLDSTYIYESSLEYKNNSFGGVLLVNQHQDSTQITMTSKFGMKIFDFMLTKDSLQTLYIVENLDKKIIKKILYTDFKMIYPVLFNAKSIKQKSDKVVVKEKCRKYIYHQKNDVTYKIKKKCSSRMAEIIQKDEKLNRLTIFHPFIKLKIQIKPLILPNE